MQTARTYGRKEGNILILGETGTGKELFAQAIHDEGGRTAPS
jgi:transcriptional regulator with PAS, ATPase and Fis domain